MDDTCFNCGEKGHYAKHCPKKGNKGAPPSFPTLASPTGFTQGVNPASTDPMTAMIEPTLTLATFQVNAQEPAPLPTNTCPEHLLAAFGEEWDMAPEPGESPWPLVDSSDSGTDDECQPCLAAYRYGTVRFTGMIHTVDVNENEDYKTAESQAALAHGAEAAKAAAALPQYEQVDPWSLKDPWQGKRSGAKGSGSAPSGKLIIYEKETAQHISQASWQHWTGMPDTPLSGGKGPGSGKGKSFGPAKGAPLGGQLAAAQVQVHNTEL